MHNGCAPAKFTFNILIKYSNFPRYIPFLKTFTKRFTVLTTEKLSADMRAQCLYEPTQNYNPYFWYTLNDPQELALILLWGQDIKVIDLEKVKQAIEEDLRKKLIVHQAI